MKPTHTNLRNTIMKPKLMDLNSLNTKMDIHVPSDFRHLLTNKLQAHGETSTDLYPENIVLYG